MKILVMGAFNSCNLGDGVICECAAELLRQRYPAAQIEIRDLLNRDRRKPRKIPDRKDLRTRWLHEKAREKASTLGWDKVLVHETARVNAQKAYIVSV